MFFKKKRFKFWYSKFLNLIKTIWEEFLNKTGLNSYKNIQIKSQEKNISLFSL